MINMNIIENNLNLYFPKCGRAKENRKKQIVITKLNLSYSILRNFDMTAFFFIKLLKKGIISFPVSGSFHISTLVEKYININS